MEKLILENIKQDNFDKKKVAEMYEDFKNKSLEGYEKTLREITDYLGEGDEVSIQKGVEEKRWEMEKVVDFSLQVFRLTNNFYFHFPGGWYRDLKKDCGSMYEDMDLIIKEKGYVEKDLELIPVQQTENNLKEKRASIIMSVFVEMIKKGYDEKELWK